MSLTVNVAIGDLDVVKSGMLVSSGMQSIDLYCGPTKETSYRIEIAFVKNEGNPATIAAAPVAEGHFRISLVNFDASTGQGTSKPLHVGNSQGRKLLLSLYVWSIGTPVEASTRSIAYTLLAGETING